MLALCRPRVLTFPLAAVAVWGTLQAIAVAVLGGPPKSGYFQWDAWWYRGILDHGYPRTLSGGVTRPTAYFPLLPWMARLARLALRSDLAAALTVEVSCTMLATCLLYAAALRWRDTRVARLTVVFWLAFPTSMFLWQFYTEGLCVAATAGALLLAAQARRHSSTGAAFLASMSRLTGLMVVPALLARCWTERALPKRWVWAAAGALGLVPVAIVQWVQADEPLGFLRAGSAWGRHISPPWTGMLALLRHWGQPNRGDVGFGLDLVVMVVFVGLAWASFHHPWPIDFRVFLVLAVALPLCSGTLQSASRYMLAAWPGFAVAADLLVDHVPAIVLVVAACVVLSVVSLHGWSVGNFVA